MRKIYNARDPDMPQEKELAQQYRIDPARVTRVGLSIKSRLDPDLVKESDLTHAVISVVL